MKLGPGKWRIALSGDTDAFLKAPQSQGGLWHLFERWFMGELADESNLRPWGIAVEREDESLRAMDEDDVEAALAGSYVEDVLAGTERAALLEFFNRMLDRQLGPREHD